MKTPTLIVYSLFFLLFPFNFLYGQKPNVKTVQIKYVQPPDKPFQDNVELYYSEIVNNAANFNISPTKEKNRIRLTGYERANSLNDADVLFKFTLGGASYETSVKKETYQKKVNDSTYVEKTGGLYTVTAYLSNSVLVQDLKNDQHLGSGAGKSAQKTYTSSVFSTYNNAVDAVNEKKSEHAQEMYKELYDDRITYFNNYVNDNYGFPQKTLYVHIARGKGKKHDYTDLVNAFSTFRSSIDNYNENGLSEEVIIEMNSCIKTWNNAIQEYEPGTKKAKIGDKIIGYLYFNVAYAHFVLREWDSVYDYSLKAKDIKGHRGQAEEIEKLVKDLQKRYLLQNQFY